MLLWILLIVVHITGFVCLSFEYIQPFDDQVINAVESVESSFKWAILQNAEDNVTSQSMKSIKLEILYFHHGQSVIKMYDAYLSLDSVAVQEISMDLIHRKVEVEAKFNFLQVDGVLSVKQNDNKPVKVKVRLMMDRTLCHGLASTKGNISRPHLESLYITSTDYTNPVLEIKALTGKGKPSNGLLSSNKLGGLLLGKLDREITYHLSQVIKTKIDQVLKAPPKMARQEISEPSSVLIKNYQIETISNANNLVDNILKFVSDFIQGQFEDKFPLPALKEQFSLNLIVVPISGSFVANKGVAEGLKTLYRTSDIVLGSGNDSYLHFYGGIGFRNLHARFNYYRAELMGIGPVGTIDVKMKPLKILLHARINISGPVVKLEAFKIKNIGGVQVGLTGFGATLSGLVSMASTWIFGLFRDQILNIVESRVTDIINKTLIEGNFDEILGGAGAGL